MVKENRLKKASNFLSDRLKYNIQKDPYQLKYVESLIAKPSDCQAVFVDAEAGTGKTSIAISIAYHLLDAGDIDQIIYIRNAVSIREMGFLPGDIAEKEAPYMQPGLDALSKLDPKNKKLIGTLIENEQLVIASTAFLRGVDWDKRKFVIIDEAQNLNLQEMQTVLTRPHDSTKIVVIGSSLQCDEGYKAKRYGEEKLLPFMLYANHFKYGTPVKIEIIRLLTNYRGRFSLYADKIDSTIEYLSIPKDERPEKYPHIPTGPSEEEESKMWEEIGNKLHVGKKR